MCAIESVNRIFRIACHNDAMMDHETTHHEATRRDNKDVGPRLGLPTALELQSERFGRLLDSLIELPDVATGCSAACALLASELTDAGVAVVQRAPAYGRGPDIVLADYPVGIGLADIQGSESINIPISVGNDGNGRSATFYLLAWRGSGDRRFSAEDEALLRGIAPRFAGFAARFTLGEVAVRPNILDPETGLWSLPSFFEQADRRFDRLDIEDKVGTMFAFGWVRCDGVASAEASPVVIRASVSCLQEMLRPVDLIGRVGPTRLAAWCDGVDHLIAAERGDRIVKKLDALLTGTERHAAIGIASRWPRSGDDPATVLARARAGLEQARLKAACEAKPVVRIWQATEP
jgi:GGDEF domain-containing protein